MRTEPMFVILIYSRIKGEVLCENKKKKKGLNCCSSFLFVRRWFHMWRLFCRYLFLISPSAALSGYLHLYCIKQANSGL